MPREQVEKRVEAFLDTCRRQGVKATHQRTERKGVSPIISKSAPRLRSWRNILRALRVFARGRIPAPRPAPVLPLRPPRPWREEIFENMERWLVSSCSWPRWGRP